MTERVTIRVNGQPIQVPADISLAAALFNEQAFALRTSVHGSPRGPLCGMGICHECRVTIDGVEHRRACMEPVVDGMEVISDG